MIMQSILVAVVVSLAAWYVLRQTWRTLAGKGKSGCGGSCSCASKSPSTPTSSSGAPLIPVEDLTTRLRRPS